MTTIVTADSGRRRQAHSGGYAAAAAAVDGRGRSTPREAPHQAGLNTAVSEEWVEIATTSQSLARPAGGRTMNWSMLVTVVSVSLLFGCGQDQPPDNQEQNLGGQLGDAYRGMLDEARQGVENANEQMQHTERAVGERAQ
jgi:hypothetical protein